jgi:RNA polymerase sigma-70 factor (ECF subfamily)
LIDAMRIMNAVALEAATSNEAIGPAREAADPLLLAAVRMVKAGDADAFEEIMIRSQRRVALLAWRILGSADDVAEALQETFLRVFRHLHRYDEDRDFFAWLYGIAVNVCRDLESRRRRRDRFFTPLDGAREPWYDEDFVGELSRRAEVALVTRAVDTLPPKERLALILRDVEGLTTEEVARILGNRAATVRVQVSAARIKIRRLITQWLGEKR